MRTMTMWRALVVAAVVASGCDGEARDPTLVITSPLDGATVTRPVVVQLDGRDLDGAGALDVIVDGRLVAGVMGGGISTCVQCDFSIQFPGTDVADGVHRIRIVAIYDLNEIAADDVMVTFSQ